MSICPFISSYAATAAGLPAARITRRMASSASAGMSFRPAPGLRMYHSDGQLRRQSSISS
jgi:hypothetical protein